MVLSYGRHCRRVWCAERPTVALCHCGVRLLRVDRLRTHGLAAFAPPLSEVDDVPFESRLGALRLELRPRTAARNGERLAKRPEAAEGNLRKRVLLAILEHFHELPAIHVPSLPHRAVLHVVQPSTWMRGPEENGDDFMGPPSRRGSTTLGPVVLFLSPVRVPVPANVPERSDAMAGLRARARAE